MHDLLRRRERSLGFSLLEVIVASVVFLIALVPLGSLWANYHSALSQSRNRLIANGLARTVMEQRIAGGYASLGSILGVDQAQTFTSKSQIRGREMDLKFDSTFLATDPGGANSALRRMVVTVEWEEDTGAKSLTYESCLFKTQ